MGKAVVITTREFLSRHLTSLTQDFLDSMEEASALANKAGILATRMLG